MYTVQQLLSQGKRDLLLYRPPFAPKDPYQYYTNVSKKKGTLRTSKKGREVKGKDGNGSYTLQEYSSRRTGDSKRGGKSGKAGINRKVYVKWYGAKKKSSPCWVSCTCEFFMYYCEMALTHEGSSSEKHSDGSSPGKTNKQELPYICKHVYAALLMTFK